MTVKRMTAMAAVAGAAAIFAIGAWGAAEAETASGPVELSIMNFWEPNPEATSEAMTMVWWGEATGTILHPINVDRTDYDTKLSTMLASRDMPDIISLIFSTEHRDIHTTYGPSGLFVNTTEQLDQGNMPELKRYVDRFPYIMEYAPDANSYMQPQLSMFGETSMRAGFSMRRDLLEQAGWDQARMDAETSTVPGLLEAFRTVYREINRDREEAVPMIHNRGNRGLSGGWVLRPILKSFGTDYHIHFNQHDEYVFGPLTENFRIGLEFINVLYAEGILHPQWLTMPEEEQGQLDWRGHRNGVWLPSGAVSHYENWGKGGKNAPETATGYIVIPPIINGEQAAHRVRSPSVGAWVINANSEHVAKAVEVSDWAYSDAGAESSSWGPEGYAWEPYDPEKNSWGRRWTLNTNGYYPETTEEEQAEHQFKTRRQLFAAAARTIPQDSWGIDVFQTYFDPDLTPDRWATMLNNQKVAGRFKELGLYIDTPQIPVQFTPDEDDERIQLESQLHTYVDEELVKFINGVRSFDNYADFVARVRELGAERLQEIYNAAFARQQQQLGL